MVSFPASGASSALPVPGSTGAPPFMIVPKRTTCLPTTAPSPCICWELILSRNRPSASVAPYEPGPGLSPIGWNWTWALASGLPFIITWPETGTNLGPLPQPATKTTSNEERRQRRIVGPLLPPGPRRAGRGRFKCWSVDKHGRSLDEVCFATGHGRHVSQEVDIDTVGEEANRAVGQGEVEAVGVVAAEAALARVVLPRAGQVATAALAVAPVHVAEDAALVGDRGLVIGGVAVRPEGAAPRHVRVGQFADEQRVRGAVDDVDHPLRAPRRASRGQAGVDHDAVQDAFPALAEHAQARFARVPEHAAVAAAAAGHRPVGAVGENRPAAVAGGRSFRQAGLAVRGALVGLDLRRPERQVSGGPLLVAAGERVVALVRLEKGVLLDVGQDVDRPGAGNVLAAANVVGHVAGREGAAGVVVAVQGDGHLVQVVGALDAGRRLADLLDRGHQQPNQDGNDGNNDEQFDQGEPVLSGPGEAAGTSHGRTPPTLKNREKRVRNPAEINPPDVDCQDPGVFFPPGCLTGAARPFRPLSGRA